MTSIYQALADLEKHNQPGVLCTVIESRGSTPRNRGSKMLVYPDGSITGTVGGGEIEGRVIQFALEALETGESRTASFDLVDPERGDPGVCGGSVEVFIEPLLPQTKLVVVGGGHVGQAVAHLGQWLGFLVVLNDDREAFCNPEVVPEADAYYPIPLKDLPDRMDFTPRTVLVLATRNMQIDIEGLPELLEVPSAYVGLISSRRRWRLTKEALLEAGVEEEAVQRVHAPIGLDINAETPEEIALSIMAEVVMKVRGGTGGSLSAS